MRPSGALGRLHSASSAFWSHPSAPCCLPGRRPAPLLWQSWLVGGTSGRSGSERRLRFRVWIFLAQSHCSSLRLLPNSVPVASSRPCPVLALSNLVGGISSTTTSQTTLTVWFPRRPPGKSHPRGRHTLLPNPIWWASLPLGT